VIANGPLAHSENNSGNPATRPEDRIIYKTIADAASRPVEEPRVENEQFEQRRRFAVIEGGNSAA
jgi:hypothetical protein